MVMTADQVGGAALSKDLISRIEKPRQINTVCKPFCSGKAAHSRNNLSLNDQKALSNLCERRHLSEKHASPVFPLVRVRHRKGHIPSALSSDYGLVSDVKETYDLDDNNAAFCDSKEGAGGCTAISGNQSEDAKRELVMLSLPAIAGQAIEPLTQLMETAYIGRLGPVQLGSAGVSISIFNIISKLFNIPLLSIATSFVAEDISKSIVEDSTSEGVHSGNCSDGKLFVTKRKQLSSVSAALLLAVGIGLFEAIALRLGSGLFLDLMGITSASPMRAPAQKFLSLRALGAPAVVVSLALQGIFRGFKDTKTPVFCLGVGNFVAVLLFPILMYYFQLGVTGAAISTVSSQYIVSFLMIWYLNKRAVLLPPELRGLDFSGYLKSGGYLIGRTLAVLVTMTLGTSMAARQGPIAMAAHQICLQVWLAVSLLTDALASSGQALIASNVSKGEYKNVREITLYVLKIGVITGVSLAIILGLSFGSIVTLFTKDADVLGIARTGVLFVSASQPINSLAFIFDGLHYGVSDFPYAACSMMAVGAISSAFLVSAPSKFGLYGVWSGLALFMTLRTAAGFNRILSKTGPWWFLHRECQTTESESRLQAL